MNEGGTTHERITFTAACGEFAPTLLLIAVVIAAGGVALGRATATGRYAPVVRGEVVQAFDTADGTIRPVRYEQRADGRWWKSVWSAWSLPVGSPGVESARILPLEETSVGMEQIKRRRDERLARQQPNQRPND